MSVPSSVAAAPQDVSGAVTSVILRYLRAHGGEAAVAEALARAGEQRDAATLEDPRSWSTHDEAIALLTAASEVTGDPDVPRHVGEEMLRQHDGTEVANLLRSLGSPAELLRNVTAAAARFSTVSLLEALEVGEAHAVIRAEARAGFPRHLYLCEFTRGLLSQVPVLFGLVQAVVTETECQARGGRFCLYSVAWEERQWSTFVDERRSLYTMAWADRDVAEARSELDLDPATRVAELEMQLAQMTQRLQEMFSTASELLSGDDLDELLSRITRRAANAVNAPSYLLVVRTSPEGPPHLHHHGFDPAEAALLAEELWRPLPDDAGGSRLVVDVCSPRRFYGRLAAVYPPGIGFMARERQILALYANYAATALDLVMALADSRESNVTSRALLDFSRSLSRIGTTDEVAETLAATVPAVAGCQRASVLLWDGVSRKLVFRAGAGLMERKPVPSTEVRAFGPEDTELIGQLMSSRAILVRDATTVDPFLRALMTEHGTGVCLFAPLYSADEFLGVVVAEFVGRPPARVGTDHDLHERLSALVDQAVTALQNARLLEQVGHLAWHDSLTGLPNRRLLQDRVEQELERGKRVGQNSAIFFIDLDRFKGVNDTLGHAAGDELIRQVAQRLRQTVRRQDTVARLGGDEFAILMPGLSEQAPIEQLAGQMLSDLHQPYRVGGNEVYTSASIGIAISPTHGESYDDLMSHADEAMYRSKALGRHTYQIYSGSVEDSTASVHLESDLHHAVERHELFVLYQPYIDLTTNRVVGVEALVRWRHPVKGVLEPVMFIPRAEETDLIVSIDAWVIGEACRQLRSWLDDGMGNLRMSVNVSNRDLLHPGFVDTVLSALSTHRISPETFEIEITERVTADKGGVMLETVEQLRRHGVRFTIDDFGTGTSSFGQIAAFPVTTIKIDRSFVQILGPDDELQTLAAAIIAMAEQLGLECVAEGVETSHQSRVLFQRGCTTAQGYFFSPPLFPGDVERLLRVPAPRTGGMADRPGPPVLPGDPAEAGRPRR
ncbi:MAG TPA: EAL domain-containing protein [Acidimicrobiales bacterium]|nr:EAL domain-containing protein [Acidimicrobiales bacterium]